VKDAPKAAARFISMPGVDDVIARGVSKCSVKIRGGCQVDLRIVDSECFGAALVYFTGSKQHNIKIRNLAKKKKYKVNEYGVFFKTPSGKEKSIAGRTEKEVYEKLSMRWIPPELREDRGEIEAAIKGELPAGLVDISDIKGDLHLHTTRTDGKMSIEEVIDSAVEKGYRYIAVTDHSKLVRIANGMDGKQLLKHVDNIREIARKHRNMHVLAGVEVDILKNGELDIENSVLRELDIVIAAVHSNFLADRKIQTQRLLRALDNKYVNVLAHPSGRLITKRDPLDLDTDKVFLRAAENNVALEINTHGERVDLNDVNCMRARELGARFAINTDSHERGQMEGMKLGVATAKRAWLEKKDVVNTYSFDKLMKALKRS
jgi:DNA polymerase (family X)